MGLPKFPEATSASARILIAVNLVPVAGIWFFGWSVADLLFLYWAENAAIGFFNIFKMALGNLDLKALTRQALKKRGRFAGTEAEAALERLPSGSAAALPVKLFMIPFFCVHYGGFMAGHFMFLALFFGGEHGKPGGFFDMAMFEKIFIDETFMLVSLSALFISHGLSFAINFIGKGEFRTAQLPVLMFAPYARIVVLHITIIAGGFLIMALGSPKILGILFILFKTAVDLVSHEAAHRRAAA